MKTKDILPDLNNTVAPCIPLRGYITKEEGGYIWIQDSAGVWIVSESDIALREEWQGCDPRYTGKPNCLYVKDGANIHEVKTYKISMQDRPITLTTPAPSVEGSKPLQNEEIAWARHIGFKPNAKIGEITAQYTTVCCYEDGWSLVCRADDSSTPPRSVL